MSPENTPFPPGKGGHAIVVAPDPSSGDWNIITKLRNPSFETLEAAKKVASRLNDVSYRHFFYVAKEDHDDMGWSRIYIVPSVPPELKV